MDPDTQREMLALLPTLRAQARGLCRSHDRADDLVQSTVEKAIRKEASFERGTNLGAWLFTIMRNTFLAELRRDRRLVEDVDGRFSGRVTTHADQLSHLGYEEVRVAIDALPEEQREALIFVTVLGMGYRDAAAACGCAEGTMKSRVSRARLRLTEMLGE